MGCSQTRHLSFKKNTLNYVKVSYCKSKEQGTDPGHAGHWESMLDTGEVTSGKLQECG